MNKSKQNVGGNAVDRFLWHGSPKATRVQKIGAFVLGSAYLLAGVFFAWIDWGKPGSVITRGIGIAFITLAARVFWKAIWPTRYKDRGYYKDIY